MNNASRTRRGVNSVPEKPSNTRFLWLLLILASASCMLYTMGWPAIRVAILGEVLPPLSVSVAVFLIVLCVLVLAVKIRLAVNIIDKGI